MSNIPAFEIYLDMLFILNFIMDYFIFWMVSKITYQKVSVKKLCLGSIIAAILYCLVVIIPFLRTIHIVFYLIMLPLIPIKVIFKPKKIKAWIQSYIVANITALVIGGMTYGMLYWVKEQNIVFNSYKKMDKVFSIWLLIFSICFSYITIQTFSYYMQKRNTGIQKLYKVIILYQDKKVDFEALLDTGNKVYDPITKYPVIIAEYKMLKPLLPRGICDIYSKEEDITCIVQEASKCEFGARIRLIPYHSLGNPSGILIGFKADQVYIEDNELIEDVIIAIYQHTLSAEDTYNGLLHGDLVS